MTAVTHLQKSVLFMTLALMLSLTSPAALAHGAEDHSGPEQVAGDYTIHISFEPEQLKAGDEVRIEAHIQDADSNSVAGLPVRMQVSPGVGAKDAKDLGDGEYTETFLLQLAGNHDVAVIFTADGEPLSADFEFPVAATPNYLFYAAIALALLIGILFAALAITKKLGVGSSAMYAGIAVVVIFLGYSVYAYNNSPAIEGCVIKIGDQEVVHCHTNVYVELCGEPRDFKWEAGDIEMGIHTHQGSHRIHIHPGKAYPSVEHAARFSISRLFQDIGLELSATSVQDPESDKVYRNDDNACSDGNDNTVQVFVKHNGASEEIKLENFMDYVWEDEDDIRVVYN